MLGLLTDTLEEMGVPDMQLLTLRSLPAVTKDDPILNTAFRTQTAAQNITKLLFLTHSLSHCADIINTMVSAAGDGGGILVLGAGKSVVTRWLLMTKACLEDAMACMRVCELHAQAEARKIRSKANNPMRHPWMQRRAVLCAPAGAQTMFKQKWRVLRARLDSFHHAVPSF